MFNVKRSSTIFLKSAGAFLKWRMTSVCAAELVGLNSLTPASSLCGFAPVSHTQKPKTVKLNEYVELTDDAYIPETWGTRGDLSFSRLIGFPGQTLEQEQVMLWCNNISTWIQHFSFCSAVTFWHERAVMEPVIFKYRNQFYSLSVTLDFLCTVSTSGMLEKSFIHFLQVSTECIFAIISK